MNTDIRLLASFPNHPKTIKLTRRLGPQGPLSFIYLLIHVAQHKPSGRLEGMDVDDIEIAAAWTGGKGEFVAALLDIGFLDEDGSCYVIHDWLEHNPYAAHAPERSAKAKRAAEARWTKEDANRCSEQSSKHNQAMPVASHSNAPSPNPNPNPVPKPAPELEHFDEKKSVEKEAEVIREKVPCASCKKLVLTEIASNTGGFCFDCSTAKIHKCLRCGRATGKKLLDENGTCVSCRRNQ